MDELLQEFLTETGENLETVDRELVRFEREPNNRDILHSIFRLVHTIKGTCGFIGLPRLEALTHAAESVIGRFRDGANVNAIAVTAILETMDRIKDILAELADKGEEPAGSDEVLIGELRTLAELAKSELVHTHLAPAMPVAPSPAQPVPATAEAVPARPQTDASPALDPVAAYLARHRAQATGDDALDLCFRSAPEPERGRDGRIEQPKTETSAETAPATETRQPGSATLRVNVDTLEHLMTMVSELVLTRNQLLDIARRQSESELKTPLQRLSLITAELQEGVMKTRMQPIGNAWSKLPRVVRDLSAELGKRIDLVMDGGQTELDRQLLDLIKDPLVHMVRNCADHAIEMPGERTARGKPAHGTIRLAAYHEGGAVTIQVSDDGRGLDLPRIAAKALAQGAIGDAELDRMSDAQIARLIFHPGLSTAESLTAISGRGVGMDVVKSNIDAVGGVIDIATRAGEGTTITIKIPLTLAIVSALIVVSGGQRFAIPQIVVRELVRVTADSDYRLETINGAPVLRLRGALLPIVVLAGALGQADPKTDDGFIVVTQIGEQQFGILVDGVFHTEEIVVKPMSSKLRHIALFSGNTILGDGAVVLIVDPNGLARFVGAIASRKIALDDGSQAERELGRERNTLLVFRAGSPTPKAVPLSLVTRLEEVEAEEFQHGSGRTMLHYRGRLIPVQPIGGAVLRRTGLQPLIILTEGAMTLALAVDDIVDIVEEVLDVEVMAGGDADVIGSAMIGGRATDIVDLAAYLPDHLAARPAGSQGEPTAQRRILLVEPSDFLREMLAPVLKASGHRLDSFASVDAVGGPLDDRVAAVLLDLDRDPQAALAFVATIRERSPATVIGMTTMPTPEMQRIAATAGIGLVIGKFDRRALLGALAGRDAGWRHAA